MLLRNCLAHNDDFAMTNALELTDPAGAAQLLSGSPVASPFTGALQALA